MNEDKIRQHLGFWLGDTCNRYLNALRDVGVVDEKKLSQRQQQVLDAKGDLLDEWAPQYWTFLKRMMDELDSDRVAGD
jgi:hypothetical protein